MHIQAGDTANRVGVAQRALAYLTPPRADPIAFPELTARERFLSSIAAGLSNAAIAARLCHAANTVSHHLQHFAKFQVASRSQAIVRARAAGLDDRTA